MKKLFDRIFNKKSMNSTFPEKKNLTNADYQREQLIIMESAYIETVELLSSRDEKTCPACREADGTRVSLKEALKSPPLPHPKCSSEECRCIYLPVT